jgi:A/G-specific adenine glycosylase
VSGFARRVVAWQRLHGRTGLPWQDTRDPYRVWVSEIMLQQTQVRAVLGYYERFLARFPSVEVLAGAQEDEVLALWSGLGYYSRARSLHRCAREVVASHGGEFPRNAQSLQELPGIGRSTAAAIASFCFGERVAILDGNVKRVLTRVLGWRDDLALAANERKLWDRAQALLPRRGAPDVMARYTQGLMDLGARICLARKPSCTACPLRDLCVASAEGAPEHYPVKSRKLERTAQALWLLRAHAADGSVWLEKRPPRGIWGGLYCLPVFESREALQAAVPARARPDLVDGAPFVHVLTHKDLHLHPVGAQLSLASMSGAEGAWFAREQLQGLGLPAPIRRLLAST